MRNLKRALSLTLASVMLLGMMVIGTSAVAGYSDVDADDNVEAIEVLQAIEVMVGDDRGFGPDRPVNRAEMAVVMGLLLNLDYNYYVSTCPFADVSGNYEWARGWVGACAANGIVSGRGEGIYDPAATVTAIEAASMMMRALGYFQNAEDYNDGFVLVTVRQGNQIGLFNGVGSDGSTPMTRNQVAQMALNALRSEMVDFTGTLGVELNGVKVNYRAEYTSRTSTEKKYNAIEGRTSDVASDANHKGQYYVQLGEELYDGKLRLNNSATDDFGRPSRHWEYDGKAIGTYMKKELLDKEWTTEVTGKDLYDLLGSDTIKNYSFDVTIDGVSIDEKTGTTDNNTVLKTGANSGAPYFDETYMAKTYKSGVGGTGKGVLTQVFVNADTKEVDVAVINTYLAKATADYNTKKDEAKFDVYALTHVNSGNDAVYYKYADACKNTDKNAEPLAISSDDFDIAEDVKKDDIVLVTVANGEIMSIAQPEVISAATLNGFSKDSYVVAEGTKYEYNTTVDYDPDTLDDYTGTTQQLKNTQYDVYLDQYGYLIGVKVVDAVNNYIFVTGIDQGASNRKNKTAEASGILLDGTFVEFTMDTKESVNYWAHAEMNHNDKTDAGKGGFGGGPLWNTWCTYTVDKDGVYTLKEVKGWDELHADGSKEKAGQSRDMNYNNKDIDDKHVSLRAFSFASASGAGADKYVYGNDKTVYIVPELDEVVSDTTIAGSTIDNPKNNGGADESNVGTVNATAITANSTRVGIISGVDSVTTGVGNVNLKTFKDVDAIEDASGNNIANPGFVYTLFDKDGYVIAAIVLGEDDGTTKNLVYSHKSDIKDEHYSSADDEWTWTRNVIFNGEEITLTEKGSSISVLEDMDQNVWYEVTYKADGTVKSAKHAWYDEAGKKVGNDAAGSTAKTDYAVALERTTDNTANNAHDFVDKIEWVENAINNSDKSTVLYEQVWGIGGGNADVGNSTKLTKDNAPSLKESTLYVNTDASKGFYVSKDVKSVLIQKNDGKSNTEWGNGTSDLENMLGDLNLTADGYCFKISAILTNGRATTVIIHDWNETGATPDGSHGSSDDISIVVANGKITIDDYDPDEMDQADVLEAIVAELESLGYTDIEAEFNGSTGAIGTIKAKKNSIIYTFQVIDEVAAGAAQDKVDAAKTALVDQDDVKADAGEAFADMDEAKAAAEDALAALVTGAGAQIDTAQGTNGFTWGAKTSGTDWANGTIGNATAEAGTEGVYPVTVFVKSGDVADSKEVNVTLKPAAFKDTTDGKAGAQVLATAQAKVTGVQISKGAAAFAQWSDVSAAVKTAVEAKVNDGTNVVVAVAQNADDGGSVDNSAGAATVNVDVTLSYKNATGTSTGVTVNFTTAVTIEAHS